MLTRRDLPQLVKKITNLTSSHRQGMTRMQILEAAAGGLCTCPTADRWFQAATQVVHLNDFHNYEIQMAVLKALEKGRETWSLTS